MWKSCHFPRLARRLEQLSFFKNETLQSKPQPFDDAARGDWRLAIGIEHLAVNLMLLQGTLGGQMPTAECQWRRFVPLKPALASAD
jgi:hypothetical protein